MRGSVQKKVKKWYADIYDGVNPATGQYRRRWVQAGTRRGDAEKLLAELVKRSHQGETVVSEKLTLGQYLTDRWLPVQEIRLRKSTHDAYRRNIELHVIPALGKRPEVKAWEVDQLVRFLGAIDSHRMAPAFHFAAHTGMRRGEVLGLRWRDLDLDAGRVSVRQALVSVAYEVSISDVETGTSRRTIDIDDDVVQVLKDWYKTRTEERDGAEPADDDLVFVQADGSSMHPDIFSQLFDRTVAKFDVPAISLHDLRHTHATLLLKAGVHVKVVSERLGHANVAFTMNVYQHVLPGMQAEAADTFAALLWRGSKRAGSGWSGADSLALSGRTSSHDPCSPSCREPDRMGGGPGGRDRARGDRLRGYAPARRRPQAHADGAGRA